MTRFHPLDVIDVRRDTRDAVVVTLAPRPEDRDAFRFVQGQYLTFRRDFDGEELRRCYSICAGLDDGVIRVGIKRVDGGAFSTWANTELKPGSVMEAMPPLGRFHAPIEPERAKSYLAFAGGSGITPVLSIVRTILAREPKSRVTLVYANRQVNSIMFREELEDLKNLHLARFSIVHVLENEAQDIDLFTGRLDADKLRRLFASWIRVEDVDTAFICGPEPMMLTVAASLREHGLGDDRIRIELFAAGQQGRARRPAPSAAEVAAAGTAEVSLTLDGIARTLHMPKVGVSVVDAALAAGLPVPYSCKAGVCSTCRARVTAGEVEMTANHALEDYEVRAGYVLTCQSHPVSDAVALVYDGH
jgi:ring-1,2-phenylacetyl-CoA epoxidase subunit PaaE